ncbi:hypothetical protein M9Y10_020110 [Tritrichomonas musculus]|uniref:Deacetylase sirtuin-type domain-containing protein n=1 Tax=Tritrichomonas musculus TaxID=1915356 RepID=A0ABR2HG72_9EUKA
MGNIFSNFIDLSFKETDAGYQIPCENTVEFAVSLLRDYFGKVVIITGAGISSHALPTFRSNNHSGIWDVLKSPILSKSYFYDNPLPSWRLAANVRSLQLHGSFGPSLSHKVIHQLIQSGYVSTVVTQNVDSLHHFDGDEDHLIEIHGCVTDFGECETCHALRFVDHMKIIREQVVPRCEVCGSVLKPPIAFFQDKIPDYLREAAYKALNSCDVLFLVGTYGAVDPVLSLAQTAKQKGAILVEINIETTNCTTFSDVVLKGKCDDIFQQIAEILFPGQDFTSTATKMQDSSD